MKKGFTLIELLVVIAIIGVLSSIVIAGINQSRARGRDAKRMLDLRQVQTALELYYSSNGFYPACGIPPFAESFSPWDATTWGLGDTDSTLCLYNSLVPNYIIKLPVDPVNRETQPGVGYLGDNAPADQGYYYRSNNGTSYILGTNLERSGTTAHWQGNWQLHN